MRFIAGDCDYEVAEWIQADEGDNFEKTVIGQHKDWVRDVAWAPNLGLQYEMVASASEDNSAKIWIKQNDEWRELKDIAQNYPVWRVSWSPTGNVLTVCTGDNKTLLYKESLAGNAQWDMIS